MTALLAVELRRLLARRLARLLAVLALAGIVAAGLAVFFTHHAETAETRAQRGRDRVELLQACMAGRIGPFPGEFGGPGLVGPGGEPIFKEGPSEELRRQGCEQFALDQTRQEDKAFHLSDLEGILAGTGVPLVLLAWLLGATAIGAEWRAGTMTTLLTWEPRRLRVMIAKVVAVMIVAVAFFAVAQALLSAALLPSALSRGDTIGTGGEWLRGVVGMQLRLGALAAMSGAIGFAIGSVGRNTAAATGIGFVYLAILEGGLLGALIPGLRPWLLVGNSIVFVSGEVNAEIFGRTPLEAGVILAVYAAGAVAIATALFRARDVT